MTTSKPATKPTTARQIYRWKSGESAPVVDELIVEEPLELRANGGSMAVIMRTPGHDLELLAGLLHAEGVIRAEEEFALETIDSNTVELRMPAALLTERWADREVISSSACGVCGAAALAVLEDLAEPLRSDLQLSGEQVCALPGLLRAQQELFSATGALHGAALIDAQGAVLACREDVGRHNAVDKLVGWARGCQRLPLGECALVVSGRVSYEIVHKAVVAGLPIVAAVSAPTSLAVDLAERWRVSLIGFVRGEGFNVYSHPSRIGSL